MCGRKRAEMEDPGIADQIGIYLILWSASYLHLDYGRKKNHGLRPGKYVQKARVV